MNTKILLFATITLMAISIISCSKDNQDTPPIEQPSPHANVNTGDLKLFVLDTAKVNTVTMLGTNETTILNRKVNSSSYIASLSLNSDASKFVYSDTQGIFANSAFTSTKTVRVANANGTGDVAIYTAPTSNSTTTYDIGFVKFGATKIYFTTTAQTFVGGLVSNVVKLNSVNFDGSGLVAENYNADPLSIYNADLTTDARYLAYLQTSPTTTKFIVLDRTGDIGAGSVVYQESITTAMIGASSPVFSYDNKFAYFAFAENQTLKVKVVNLMTLTSETKTIATGFTPTSFNCEISVASDSNRGVIVVDSYNNLPTKTYVFNLSTSASTTFNNNDENISTIKAF